MFKKNINFVALNIDNTKWTDEVSQYRVRGVPHFVFLDGQGRQLAAAVGRVPQQVRLSSATMLFAECKSFTHSKLLIIIDHAQQLIGSQTDLLQLQLQVPPHLLTDPAQVACLSQKRPHNIPS